MIRLKTSPGSSLARPPRNESSITNAQATTSAPVDCDQVAAGAHRAAGGQDVVDQEDAAAGPEGVGVDLELVGAVFELIFQRDRGIGELARLADRHEAGAHLQGQRVRRR